MIVRVIVRDIYDGWQSHIQPPIHLPGTHGQHLSTVSHRARRSGRLPRSRGGGVRSHGSQHPISYPFGGGGVELWARAAGSGGTGGHPQSKPRWYCGASAMALWRPISSVTAPPAHIALRANLPCMVLTHKLWPASARPIRPCCFRHKGGPGNGSRGGHGARGGGPAGPAPTA